MTRKPVAVENSGCRYSGWHNRKAAV